MTFLQTRVAIVVSTVACAALAADDAEWRQWRGPTRNGLVAGPPWPATLQEDALKQRWRVADLSPSYSGPIVADGRVFITETVGRKTEVVKALDRSTGRELWRAEWPGAMNVPFFAASNGSWIRATPAYDGDSLYVAGIRDVLVCLNAADGKERWKVDFVERYKTALPAFGFVSSPLVDGNAVYVQAGASFVKLDKATGAEIWRTLRDEGGMYGSAFSSPVFATLHGQRQLLVQGRTTMSGIDPESGSVLWSQTVPADRGMNIYTPVVFGNGFFASANGGKSLRFDVARVGDTWNVSQAWEYKAQGYMSTPVVVDGHAYMHAKNQRLLCLDLATGREKWTSPQTFGKYWSTLAQKDRILALDEKGILYLIRATPEKFDLIDQRKVGENAWAHLAVVGDEVYVRELNALTCYRWGR